MSKYFKIQLSKNESICAFRDRCMVVLTSPEEALAFMASEGFLSLSSDVIRTTIAKHGGRGYANKNRLALTAYVEKATACVIRTSV